VLVLALLLTVFGLAYFFFAPALARYSAWFINVREEPRRERFLVYSRRMYQVIGLASLVGAAVAFVIGVWR
jgi:hypothetical protein